MLAKNRIGRMFNENIAAIVIALTKPEVDGILFFSKKETTEYYLSNIVKREKVIRCKAIDRLHNLRTLPNCTAKKIMRMIIETEEKYIPLFGTNNEEVDVLIMQKINTELENLHQLV